MSNDAALNPRKRGLGRGLDALFESDDGSAYPANASQEETTPAQNEGPQRKTLGVAQLVPNPKQPRKAFDPEGLKELAASLTKYGLLQPITVRPKEDAEDTYEIIAGERRWRAAQIAQLHEVPVTIQSFSDAEALQIGLVENLQRHDLNPIEEALGYRLLSEEHGFTQKTIAEMVSKSRSQITNMMRLLTLPDRVQEMLRNNEISIGHARALIGRDDAEEMAQKVTAQDMSVRDIETLGSEKKTAGTPPEQQKDSDTRALEHEISDTLGMEVDINVKKDGQKGSVKISFKSLEQLDFLLHKLSRD